MNIQEFASNLDGRERGSEITKNEEQEAKKLGFVIVFGASDDLVEFRGAINDEDDCYDGGTVYLEKESLFHESCSNDCKYQQKARENCKTIKVIWWDDGDYCWTYETDIPHATFEITEDGEKYCRGIVFDLNTLQGGN